MAAKLIALAVLAIVAAATFAIFWLIERRSSRARILKERLGGERKAPERTGEEELALLPQVGGLHHRYQRRAA